MTQRKANKENCDKKIMRVRVELTDNIQKLSFNSTLTLINGYDLLSNNKKVKWNYRVL